MQEEKLRLEDLLESSNSGNDDDRINNVAIIGAGIMGRGIAQTVASMGLEVVIIEVDSEKLSLPLLLQKGLKAAPQGPIKLNKNLESYISSIFNTANDEFFPEVLDTSSEIFEGLKKQVSVNKYERSSIARAKCIEAHHGFACQICSFNFEQVYGALGKDFIHVHHITPIHTIGKNYKIDYANDLIPVCPNCHAMLHRKINGKFYSVAELKELVKSLNITHHSSGTG